MKLLIMIPAYNERENIERVINDLCKYAPRHDYLIINDGSTDGMAKLCRERGYRMLSLPANLGLAGAVQAGMKYAERGGYDAALQFDADGQHRGEFIEEMLHKLSSENDIVIGSRFLNQKKPFTLRMAGSTLITLAIWVTTGVLIKDPTSGMRMYNKRMIHEFATQLNYAPEPDTISYLLRRGARVAEVQVQMNERVAGVSYLNWTRSMGYMLRMGISILLIQWFRGGSRLEPLRKEGGM